MSCYGIDLGTTTTLIAAAKPEGDLYRTEVRAIPQRRGNGQEIEGGQRLLPSFAFFPITGPIVGTEAKEAGPLKAAEKCVRAVKRLMGRDVPPFSFNNISYSPSDIAALYLKYVLQNIALQDPDGIQEITITVPASFTSKQRQDTLLSVEKAFQSLGLPLDAKQRPGILISEPLAALLSYLNHDIMSGIGKINLSKSPVVLVYDIGGGTLDLTLVQLGGRNVQRPNGLSDVDFSAMDVGRYTQIGGEDFDEALGRWALDRFLEQNPHLENLILLSEEKLKYRHTFLELGERLKIQWNESYSDDEANLSVGPIPIWVRDQFSFSANLDHREMLRVLHPFLGDPEHPKNCIQPIDKFLRRVGLSRQDVDYFHFVGGMSRFLPLQEALEAFWGRPSGFILHRPEAAEHEVAMGAAIYSGMKYFDQRSIEEPAADAYYIRTVNSFRKLLGRKDGAQNTTILQTMDSGRFLNVFLFAGEEFDDANDPRLSSTLIYQGGQCVDMGREYPSGTSVSVELAQQGELKIPLVRASIAGRLIFEGQLGAN